MSDHGYPEGDPNCEICNDTGEVFGHAPDCRSDFCALNGDYESCAGMLMACSCQAGKLAAPAILEIEAAKLEGEQVVFLDIEADTGGVSVNPFHAGITITPIDFDPGSIEDDWDFEPMDPEEDYD